MQNIQQTKSKVFSVIEKQTNLKASQINPDLPIREQANLDSMQFVAIIAHVETVLNIELPIEAMAVDTLDQFLTIVYKAVAKGVSECI